MNQRPTGQCEPRISLKHPSDGRYSICGHWWKTGEPAKHIWMVFGVPAEAIERAEREIAAKSESGEREGRRPGAD